MVVGKEKQVRAARRLATARLMPGVLMPGDAWRWARRRGCAAAACLLRPSTAPWDWCGPDMQLRLPLMPPRPSSCCPPPPCRRWTSTSRCPTALALAATIPASCSRSTWSEGLKNALVVPSVRRPAAGRTCKRVPAPPPAGARPARPARRSPHYLSSLVRFNSLRIPGGCGGGLVSARSPFSCLLSHAPPPQHPAPKCTARAFFTLNCSHRHASTKSVLRPPTALPDTRQAQLKCKTLCMACEKDT